MHPSSGPDITTTVRSISQELGNQNGDGSRPGTGKSIEDADKAAVEEKDYGLPEITGLSFLMDFSKSLRN